MMTDNQERDDMSVEVGIDTKGKASITFAEEPQIIDNAASLRHLQEHEEQQQQQQPIEEMPLLLSMMEVMAISYLVFMYADLRALSSTGRISTRFEHIAVESDYSPRFEADFICGEKSAGSGKAHKAKDGGLSTAQIMAVMLLEINNYTTKAKKKKEKKKSKRHSMNLLKYSSDSSVGANPETYDKRLDRKNMTKLLQVYASIIGADLAKNRGEIEVRKSVRDLAASTTTETSSSQPPLTQRVLDFTAAVERIMHLKESKAKTPDPDDNNDKTDGSDTKDTGEEDNTRSATSSNASQKFRRRSYLMEMAKTQQALIRLQIMNEDEDMEKIINNIFSSEAANLVSESTNSEDGMVAVSSDDMRKIMHRAVTSRIYSKLDFMAKFFEKGTVSHLMALSNVRVVWFNDWYPSKELTYGICVDEVTKLVIVVFRGAITKTDWTKAMDYNFATATNPVEGGPATVKLHNGFYSYLFRKRQDTGTTKYHQIAEVAHRIGSENFGEDYRLVVCGHSLGAALSTVFSFWASTDDRFTRNGPLQVYTFGSPYVGANDFADEWRRQEEAGKLRYARFYNHNDLVSYGPSSNIWPTSRGSRYRHVGLGVAIRPVPRHLKFLRRGFEPGISYVPDERPIKAYCRGLGNTVILHIGNPLKIKSRHTLQELIKRVADGKREEERLGKDKKGNGFGMMDKSLNVLYDIKANL